ncbi:MAG TPA: hypothetical protein VMV48_04330 [Gallionellaceae bacterium]|nr:hypothetical protein [Gallionellaceae bacterium]
MLIPSIDSPEKPITVTPAPVEVVIEEDGGVGITIVLPPLEDILEMQTLKKTHFSLKEFATQNWHELEVFIGNDLSALEAKQKRFGQSPIYLNRLANLAEMTGRKDKELEYLKEAFSLSGDQFFNHRIGDSLLSTQNTVEAEKIFSALNLETDVYANLRMAFFNIQRQQFDLSQEFVDRALQIDPLHYGARMIKGGLAIVTGQYEQAIRNFRIAGEERPGVSSIHTNMAIAYLCLRRPSKAMTELKKAVALDPLNQNAVVLLADLSFSQKCDEDAVPGLRFLLKFEQKEPEIWARLARAMLRLGDTNEAISSLKRQGSLEDTSGVWNNLGVAYLLQKNIKKAYESLIHAMKKDTEKSKVYFLAARNLASLFMEHRQYAELTKFTSTILSEDIQNQTSKDDVLSDILAMHLHSLWSQGLMSEYVRISEKLLSQTDVAPRLQVWVLTGLIAHRALEIDGGPSSIELINKYINLMSRLGPEDNERKERLLNNIAFVYAEYGDYEKAEWYLGKLGGQIHTSAYPTSILGLINMRKGNVERGENLYSEAIQLAHNKIDKIRIRQKLNFEFGRLYLEENVSKANRYLNKVIAEKGGSIELVALAKQLQKRIPHSTN